MRRSKRNELSCYFCGAPATGRDHLPPKTMFDDPKPTNLVTVPSCDRHNSQQSKDDEYFGVIIKTASGQSPVAEKLVREGVAKRFLRKPALLQSLMQKFRSVELRTSGGLIVGHAPGFEYHRGRISTVVERMTRGFYYKFGGGRLPLECRVNVFRINPRADDALLGIIKWLPTHTIVPDVFEYKFMLEPTEPYFSAWFFRFYGQTLIVSFTETTRNGIQIPRVTGHPHGGDS